MDDVETHEEDHADKLADKFPPMVKPVEILSVLERQEQGQCDEKDQNDLERVACKLTHSHYVQGFLILGCKATWGENINEWNGSHDAQEN